MNGHTMPLLLWTVNFLIGIVMVLLGMVLKLHKESDEEHRRRTDEEINKIRNRVHDLTAQIMRVDADARRGK